MIGETIRLDDLQAHSIASEYRSFRCECARPEDQRVRLRARKVREQLMNAADLELTVPDSATNGLALSADGKLAAVAGGDGKVYAYDPSARKLLHTLQTSSK